MIGPWGSRSLFSSRDVLGRKTAGGECHSFLLKSASVRNLTTNKSKGPAVLFQNSCSPQASPSFVISYRVLSSSWVEHCFGEDIFYHIKLDFPQHFFIVLEKYPGSCSPSLPHLPCVGLCQSSVLLYLFFPER